MAFIRIINCAHCFTVFPILYLLGRALLYFCNTMLVQTGAANYAWLLLSPPSAQLVLIWQLLLWIQSPAIALM